MQTSTVSSALPPVSQPQGKAAHAHGGRDHVKVAQDTARQAPEAKGASDEILKKIQELTDGGNHSVRFEMDSEINVLVVKVYNSKTDELVRQIPAESLLGTAKALREFSRGLMVDDKT